MKSTRSSATPPASNREITPSRSAAPNATSTASGNETTARSPPPSVEASSSTSVPSLAPGQAAPGPWGAKRRLYSASSISSLEVFVSSTNASPSSDISVIASGVAGSGQGSGNAYGGNTSSACVRSGSGGP